MKYKVLLRALQVHTAEITVEASDLNEAWDSVRKDDPRIIWEPEGGFERIDIREVTREGD